MKNRTLIINIKNKFVMIYNKLKPFLKGMLLSTVVLFILMIIESLLNHLLGINYNYNFFNGWVACITYLIGYGILK